MTVRLTAAVATTLAAAGAATLLALASGTAAAAPGASVPGKCVDNVNVRAEPDMTSDIVAVCERGQSVKTGEVRNGFVQLVDLKGWSAEEFVSVNGKTPVKPTATRAATPTATPDATGTTDATDTTGATDGTGATDTTGADPTTDETPGADQDGSGASQGHSLMSMLGR